MVVVEVLVRVGLVGDTGDYSPPVIEFHRGLRVDDRKTDSNLKRCIGRLICRQRALRPRLGVEGPLSDSQFCRRDMYDYSSSSQSSAKQPSLATPSEALSRRMRAEAGPAAFDGLSSGALWLLSRG